MLLVEMEVLRKKCDKNGKSYLSLNGKFSMRVRSFLSSQIYFNKIAPSHPISVLDN